MLVMTLARAQEKPLNFTAKSINQGRQDFKINCVSCHGLPATGKPLTSAFPDLGAAETLAKPDTVLYTTLTDGRNAMPAFKTTLSREKRWAIINYIRSFDTKMKDKIIGKLTFPKIDFQAKLQDNKKSITYTISEIINKKKIPLSSLDVNIFAKRMFGKILLFDVPLKTDKKGILTVTIPENIIGDAEGNIEIIAQIVDIDKYGEVQTSVKSKTKAMHSKNILSQRCMWGKGSRTPIWLLCSYFGVLIIIFGGLVFIIIKLIGLRKLG